MNAKETIQARPARSRRKSGSAMITVMGFLMLLVMAGATVTLMTGQSAFRSRKTLRGSQALSIAEAGVADLLDRMQTNYAGGINVKYEKEFSGGTFTVATKLDMTSGNLLINSVGQFDGETRETSLELIGDKYVFWDELLSECAIIAGGDAILETAAPVITGRIHANRNILHSIGNLEITGDLTAVGTIQLTPKTGYKAISGHKELLVPNYLPLLDKWKKRAQDGGIYYPGSVDLGKVTLAPANGVIYVNGDVEISNNTQLKGTLVASGSITVNNNFSQTPFESDWPSMLAGVNVNLFNRNNYEGLIFAGNNITTRNNKTINGQLVALNNVYVENGATLAGTFKPPEWDPDGEIDPDIIVGGWVK